MCLGKGKSKCKVPEVGVTLDSQGTARIPVGLEYSQ